MTKRLPENNHNNTPLFVPTYETPTLGQVATRVLDTTSNTLGSVVQKVDEVLIQRPAKILAKSYGLNQDPDSIFRS